MAGVIKVCLFDLFVSKSENTEALWGCTKSVQQILICLSQQVKNRNVKVGVIKVQFVCLAANKSEG